MKTKKLHELELLLYITVRTSIFDIQNSNDYFLFVNGLSFGKKDLEFFFENFHKYLINEYKEFNFKDRNLSLTVSFLSGFKGNSLSFIRQQLLLFLKEEETQKLKLVVDFSKKNNLQDLIKKYSEF